MTGAIRRLQPPGGNNIVRSPVNHTMPAPISKGKLTVILQDTISTGSPVRIVYPQKKRLSARVHAFIDWVQELFSRNNVPACRSMPIAAEPAPANAIVHGPGANAERKEPALAGET